MLLTLIVACAAGAAEPFSGKQSVWNGYERFDFEVDGKPVLVVVPKQPAAGRPWVWHGEFFGHKPDPDIALLGQGFHIVYMSVPDMLGCPAAVAHWNAFYRELTEKYGLAQKAALVGLSRGGLYCYNWAAANPDKVACIYGDAPVCDFKSWPGGKGKGPGSPRDWQLVIERYGFKDEAAALAYDKNPVDNLQPLAKARVPLLHVYGDADEAVPWDENTGIVAQRYRELGGEITLIAKPGGGHHPHGLDDSTPIIEFIAKHALTPAAARRESPGGTIHQIHYTAATGPGGLPISVDYYLWIPPGVTRLRGVIVHQHGCGVGASLGGQTAADDLHWQALARNWDCALLGSCYEPREGVDCRLWCDPRNGSGDRFLQALSHFAVVAGHAELETVPWCLWGHSGGGFWASLMQVKYPERIVAIWLRSGTAYGSWTSGEIEAPKIPDAAYQVPVMGNPGVKEKDDERFHKAWDGLTAMQQAYQAQGAFFQLAPDPRTSHECGDSRYLAIPFFDFWLRHRLPASADEPTLQPIASAQADWDATMAGKLSEYIRTGAVSDDTPPPAPRNVTATRNEDGGVTVAWDADADLESGIRCFIVERNGARIGQVPEKPVVRFGRPLFQTMSYHDTPEQPLPAMQFTDQDAPTGDLPTYRVRTVNSVELESEPTATR